jgi:hypothetical protein
MTFKMPEESSFKPVEFTKIEDINLQFNDLLEEYPIIKDIILLTQGAGYTREQSLKCVILCLADNARHYKKIATDALIRSPAQAISIPITEAMLVLDKARDITVIVSKQCDNCGGNVSVKLLDREHTNDDIRENEKELGGGYCISSIAVKAKINGDAVEDKL